ncbi:EamA family transporter [Longispora albida]|uniref:EamA family transporter n=1 Tax=Longispora albida TaxID=203523 RepID=UPI00035C1FCF|nr:EamA family transporter [Longispora albida]
MISAVLALTASGLWGSSYFLGGSISRRMPAITVLFIAQPLILVGTCVIVVGRGLVPDLSAIGWGVLAGLAAIGAMFTLYRAMAHAPMGVVAPIGASAAVLPVVVGLATGERPSVLQLSGVAAALAGVALVARAPGSTGKTSRYALLMAVVSAVFVGIVYTAVPLGAQADATTTLIVQRITMTALTAAIVLATRQQISVEPGSLGRIAIIAGTEIAANVAYSMAATRPGAMLSVVSALASLSPVVTALIARQVLAERLSRLQLAGVAVTIAGVAGAAAA